MVSENEEHGLCLGKRYRIVIEESIGDDGIGILNGCPWYAFVLSPKGRRLITYVYPLLL
jgi:hypothetical protein